MKGSMWLSAALVGLALTVLLTACGGGEKVTPPPPPISLAVSPAAMQSVDQGQTINYSATVMNDSSGRGITWKVTCSAANCGSLSSQNGSTTVYTAPSPVAATLAVSISATSVADPTKSAAGSITVAVPPSITTASLPSVMGGDGYGVTLQESGGVAPYTWTVTSAGSLPAGLSLGSDGTISGTPIQGGIANFTVQVADSGNPPLMASANLSIDVTVTPLSISTTSLPNATVDAAYSQTIQATGGIPPYTWTVSSGTLPSWATLRSPDGTVSGIPSSGGTANFTVQVADAEPAALTSTQPLSVKAATAASVNDSELKGQYAFLFNGFDDASGSQLAAAGSLVADGNGKITAGIEDENGPSSAALGVALTGTYNIGADNRGALTITTAAGSRTYAVVLGSISSGIAQRARFVEFDDTTGTTGQRGSGAMRLQDATAFSLSKINGPYAFGFIGQDASGNRTAMAGSFSADAGTIPSGVADQNVAGTATNPSLTGSYTAPSATYGRMTLHLAPSGASSLDLSAYVISSTELLAVSTKALSSDGLTSGQILAQASTSFGTNALDSPSVYYQAGVNTDAPATEAIAEVGQLSPDGNGNLSVTYDNQNGSGFARDRTFSASYSVVSGGRVAITGWYGNATNAAQILYLVDQNKAFFLDTSGAVGFGFVEPQAIIVGGFSNSSLSGNFAAVTVTPSTPATLNGAGVATPDGSSAFSAAACASNTAGLFVSQSTTGHYSIDVNGRGTVTQLNITTAGVNPLMFVFAAAAILAAFRKPRRGKSRLGLAMSCLAIVLVIAPAGCPICPNCKPVTNELVIYVISPQKAVMIHQWSSSTAPEVTIVEQ